LECLCAFFLSLMHCALIGILIDRVQNMNVNMIYARNAYIAVFSSWIDLIYWCSNVSRFHG
jgi:hypothetical protein